MRKEIVIRLQSSEKGHKKAIKVAAAVSGVESVTLAGEDRNLLLVIGFGVDSNDLTEKLRRKVGRAEVVELRSVDAEELMHPYGGGYYPAATPYNTHLATGGRRVDPYYGGAGGGGYPPHQRGGARDHHYYNYTPMTMATGGYYGGAGAGGYPQQYGQSYYPPATTNTHTVVHHQYNNDPESCTIM